MASKTEELLKRAKRFTDKGEWKNSWHWPKGKYNIPNTETLKAALSDLHCHDMKEEIYLATAIIKERYSLAREISDFIKFMEEE